MQETYQHDGQQHANLDLCLERLAQVLKAIGVEEFTIADDSRYHLIDNELQTDQRLISNFCTLVTQLYEQATANN